MSLITGGTANIVPCVTNASASLSAAPTSGGGGGGGGGANLVVSTITFPSTGIIYMRGGLAISDADTIANTDGNIFTGIPAGDLNAGLDSSLVNGIGFTSPSALGTGIQIAGTDGYGALIVAADSVNGNLSSLSLLASAVNISSLNVSSINGAAPGGGGSIPQNLIVSSLTAPIANISSIQSQYLGNTAGYLAFNVGGSGSTTWGGNNNTFIRQNNQKVITFDGNVNGEVDFTNMASVKILNSDLQVSTINGAVPGSAVIPQAISVSSITNLSSINLGTPGLLQVAGDVAFVGGYIGADAISTNRIMGLGQPAVTISTLNVSSINGASYPPAGGSSVGFSTIRNTAASTIVCLPGGATTLIGFSTINGNGYGVNFNAQLQSFSGNFNDTQNILGLTTTSGGATQVLTNQGAPYLSSLSAGFDLPQIGGCTNVIADGNFITLQVYNNTLSNVSINLTESYSVNFGPAGA